MSRSREVQACNSLAPSFLSKPERFFILFCLCLKPHLKLSVNWSKHDNSEDDHEDQGEDCEAGIDLEHVEEEDGELEQVADEVRNLPGYDFHNYHWVHGTLHTW